MLAWSVLFAVLCTSWCSASSWHYPDENALTNGWPILCSTGTKQSPIDLDGTLPAEYHTPITYKNYFTNPDHNNKWFKGYLENNGHTVKWYPSKNTAAPLKKCLKTMSCPAIQDGPFGGLTHSHKYYLAQIHFHWGELGNLSDGSEHTVSGVPYPMEMHMVHVEDKFVNASGEIDWAGAKMDSVGIAVLAVFFKVDPIKPENNKPLQGVDNEVAGLPKPERRDAEDNDHMVELRNLQMAVEKLHAKRAKRDTEGEALRWNPGAMLRKATNPGGDDSLSTYFTYHGSLTTPGCEEVVTWVVFQRPLAVAAVQINAFAALFPDNFRPVKTGNVDQKVEHLIHGKIGKPKGIKG